MESPPEVLESVQAHDAIPHPRGEPSLVTHASVHCSHSGGGGGGGDDQSLTESAINYSKLSPSLSLSFSSLLYRRACARTNFLSKAKLFPASVETESDGVNL